MGVYGSEEKGVVVMKGVRKTSTNCWTAEYSNLKTGRLRVSFNTEKEAIAQRKKWEIEFGVPKHGSKQIIPKSEILAGTKINRYTVVGDTGKRDVNGGAIALVLHENGQYYEIPWNGLIKNNNTGYVGTEEHSKKSKENITRVMEKFVIRGSYLPLLSKQEANSGSSSGYRGITWDSQRDGWNAVVAFGGKRVLRFFSKSFEEAVFERNKFVMTEINPLLIEHELTPVKEITQVIKNKYVIEKERNASLLKKIKRLNKAKKSKGVYYNKTSKKWVAEKASWEKPRSLGVFKTEQEALEAKQNYVKTVIEPQIKKLQEEINHGI